MSDLMQEGTHVAPLGFGCVGLAQAAPLLFLPGDPPALDVFL